MIRRATLAMTVAMALLAFGTADAQEGRAARPGRGGRAGAGPAVEAGVSPVEIQRMFDSYALMQAQDQLQIGEEQFAKFLTRYKALLDVRRRSLMERNRIVMELRKQLNGGQPDDTVLRDRLKALQDVEARTVADERKAYEAIDQLLDIRQQAKFRVFEEQMERKKLDLIARARQANRPTRNQ